MAVNNSLAQKPDKKKFSVAIQSEGYKNLINNTLGGERAIKFISAVSSAVAVNPGLQDCDAGTILSAALLGESLQLSPSPQLGQYFLVPYEDRKNSRKVAQFQIGYKGYIQLAIRTGKYKKLNVMALKDGELIRYNPLEEEIEVKLIEDEDVRDATPTIGYYAMFEYINGFKKVMYWNKKKMEAHALRYSKGYAAKKGYTFWEKDFDGMALKTMLRQLISKWGIMTVEFQDAAEKDMGVISEGGKVDFVDNAEEPEAPETEPEEEETPAQKFPDDPAQEVPNEQFDFFAQ